MVTRKNKSRQWQKPRFQTLHHSLSVPLRQAPQRREIPERRTALFEVRRPELSQALPIRNSSARGIHSEDVNVNAAQISQQSAFLRLCQSRIHGDGRRRFEVEFSGVLPHVGIEYEHALAFRRPREQLAGGKERSQDVGMPGARLHACRACVPQEDEPAPRGSQTLAEVPGVFGVPCPYCLSGNSTKVILPSFCLAYHTSEGFVRPGII
jgi:hypothetical protein